MDVPAYLRRIAYSGSQPPSATALRELHRQHLFTVPFENLDIALGTPICLDLRQLYEKIVVRRRGGFCYELNGLFAALLAELGYSVRWAVWDLGHWAELGYWGRCAVRGCSDHSECPDYSALDFQAPAPFDF